MKRLLLPFVAVASILSLVGCGNSGGEDYDPNKIAVKQPGSGPPPMNPPMSGGSSKPSSGTTGSQ